MSLSPPALPTLTLPLLVPHDFGPPAPIDLSGNLPFAPADTEAFQAYINTQLALKHARWGYGGYLERRRIYEISDHFRDSNGEFRSIHLGVDYWLPAGTPVVACYHGVVHSTANNATSGDYGGTVILQHNANGIIWNSLYGHLSPKSIEGLTEGKQLKAGERIGVLGEKHENVNWPPHLHFQLILDIGKYRGDYPGVCAHNEVTRMANNCPNPLHYLGG